MRVIKNFKGTKAALNKSTVKAVTDATLFVQGDAVQRAPVDTGDLRGSASNRIDERPSSVEGVTGFSASYALEQHENMAIVHPRGGEAKFLENAFTQNEAKIEKSIQDAIEEGMK